MDTWSSTHKTFEEISAAFEINSLVELDVPREDLERLQDACGDDVSKLRRYIKRRVFGDRVCYILGHEEFCGRCFKVDRRVYVPDKDSIFLVDSVVKLAVEKYESIGRSVKILEVGVGCGCLAISVQERLGDAAILFGVDVDGSALEVAAENIKRFNVDIALYESDVFESIPKDLAPDVIYSNPPWGNDDPRHYGERSLSYFLDMPRIASFAVDGVTELHESIIFQERERQWGADIMLYNGVMDKRIVKRLAQLAKWSETMWFSNNKYSLLHCRNQDS